MSARVETKPGAAATARKIVAVLIILFAAFLLTLPAAFVHKTPPPAPPAWKLALPKAGGDGKAAMASLLRARQLFEADVRPALIEAGFIERDDMPDLEPGYVVLDESEAQSAWLTERLWQARAFPEIQDALLQGLLDTSLSPEYRVRRFAVIAGRLSAAAETLAGGNAHSPDAYEYFHLTDDLPGFVYFAFDPRVFGYMLADGSPEQYLAERTIGMRLAGTTPEEKARYEEKLRLAGRALPLFLRDMQAYEASRKEKNDYPTAREESIWEDGFSWNMGSMGSVLLALWEHRDSEAATSAAFAILQSGEMTPGQRYGTALLAARNPGLSLSEYLFWDKYREDLDSLARCVGTAPYFFGYIIGCCDDDGLGEVLHAEMKARPLLELGKTDGEPGLRISPLDAVPPVAAEDPLYFLADMSFALEDAPDYDLSRSLPIFAGTTLRYLENQPLLLPLDLKREDDAALVRWHLDGGAAQGRLMLFSARGKARDVARHLGDIHLAWWPKSDEEKEDAGSGEPDLTLLHPGNGPFLKALLPNIGGEAARRFLGPITGVWYLVEEVEGDRWYEAKPDPALYGVRPGVHPGSPGAEAPAFLLSATVDDALGDEITYAVNISLSRRLMKEYPGGASDSVTPQEAFDYVRDIRNEAYGYGIRGKDSLNRAAELFWRFRHDEKAVEILRGVLSNENIPAYKRLEEARRAVGLPAEVL